VLHSDLKVRNVLLKTDASARGCIAKVADFGLAVRMDCMETHVSAFQVSIVGRAKAVCAMCWVVGCIGAGCMDCMETHVSAFQVRLVMHRRTDVLAWHSTHCSAVVHMQPGALLQAFVTFAAAAAAAGHDEPHGA
jgi:hypothetical protein